MRDDRILRIDLSAGVPAGRVVLRHDFHKSFNRMDFPTSDFEDFKNFQRFGEEKKSDRICGSSQVPPEVWWAQSLTSWKRLC
jgi:hypothetical protein